MNIELNEREIPSLKGILEQLFINIYRIDEDYLEDYGNTYKVEDVDLDDNELGTLIKMAKQVFSEDELRYICSEVDEDLELVNY